jgi:hypothetical protein
MELLGARKKFHFFSINFILFYFFKFVPVRWEFVDWVCFPCSMSILGLIFHHSTGAKCGSRGPLAGHFSLGRECKGNEGDPAAFNLAEASRRLTGMSYTLKS